MNNEISESGAFWNYLRSSKKNVSGWLQRVDAEVLGAIIDHQLSSGIFGSCIEIGVHHGKSFIPLCLSLRPNEGALCIDIFDEQDKNLDSSGHGNYEILVENLRRFGVPDSRYDVIKGSSDDLSANQILDKVDRARIFSIDGGHWASIVENDLELAEESLAEGGVIALDDYCRVEWPDVTAGYHFWQRSTASNLVPFAAGSNKLFLCNKDFAEDYRKALRTDFLKLYFAKTYSSYSAEVDCYRIEPVNQDEEKLRGTLRQWLKLYRPDIYQRLHGWHARFKL